MSMVAVSIFFSGVTGEGSMRSEPSGFSKMLTSWSLVRLFFFVHSLGRLIIRVLLLPQRTNLRVCFFNTNNPLRDESLL